MKHYTNVGKNRLLKLADFLETVDKNRFDLSLWRELRFSPSKCGTVACAVGWATTIPSFKKAGFTFESNAPKYKTYDSWEAVTKFFSLDNLDAFYLFSIFDYNDENPTPKMVTKRIRSFVKKHFD